MAEADRAGWRKVPPLQEWRCPECGELSPVEEWREIEVPRDCCDSEEARACPRCDQPFVRHASVLIAEATLGRELDAAESTIVDPARPDRVR